MNKILVTGCAGFIGSHLADRLLKEGYEIVGIDNFYDYYDPKIKERNINQAIKSDKFKLYRVDILNESELSQIFNNEKLEKIIHLAARAGVRPSIKNPKLYGEVNVLGTVNILSLAVKYGVEHIIFGSSSSVYGKSTKIPFTEDDSCENIISPYGASKRSAEFFVESFHRLHGLKCTILRFFTVYGPRGRPDMAPAIFTKAILENQIIEQFGNGLSSRDYTYIDDIVDGIIKSIENEFYFEIINLGNNHPVKLLEMISILERLTSKKVRIKKRLPQAGDVQITWANVVKARKLLGWEPKTRLSEGLRKYIEWLKFQKL